MVDQQSDTEHRSASVRDVAALARVSPTTVSNVLSGNRPVATATRDRVRQAIDELGYRPNLSARNLRLRRGGLIALAVPEIDVPYFAELVRLVVQAARRRGYTVLIDQTEGDADAERFVLGGMNPGMVDGILFSPLRTDRAEFEQRRDRTPLVLLGERITGRGIDHVGIDNVAAATAATRHLADQGRRRIAALGHRTETGTAALRSEGYRQALDQAGLPYDEDLVVITHGYHRTNGAMAVRQLLQQGDPPDALFCYNDLLALGALRALHEAGLRVPEDVAVVGFDDIDDGHYSIPTLSTIAPDKARIAESSLDLLLARMADPAAGPSQVTVPYTLEVRESSRPI
ncbi:LacI family DNA-binding transcriptional regulator [Microlunatus sp. GCM10028923]|uniref:LacI family DNA-binding transcriptional regulator n=1 Tax=Microlunatus sp. GCM10028923 TaxID=3273400 RepID=UPI00360BF224